MPIPDTTADGILPEGVHDATVDEVAQRFGAFVRSDRRVSLVRKFREYMEEVRATRFVRAVILDGSFVTDTDEPNDIDMIVVLKGDHDFDAELRPFEYNVVSKRMVRKRFGFDLFAVPEGSAALSEWVEFFSRVRDRPALTKGLVKVAP